MGKKISYCGFNMVESLLRHTPEQLEVFLNRMNTLRLNTLMVQYDYGFKHYRELLLQYCSRYGIELRLMVFGPRSFFRLADWNPDMLSRQKGIGKIEPGFCADLVVMDDEFRVLQTYVNGELRY